MSSTDWPSNVAKYAQKTCPKILVFVSDLRKSVITSRILHDHLVFWLLLRVLRGPAKRIQQSVVFKLVKWERQITSSLWVPVYQAQHLVQGHSSIFKRPIPQDLCDSAMQKIWLDYHLFRTWFYRILTSSAYEVLTAHSAHSECFVRPSLRPSALSRKRKERWT